MKKLFLLFVLFFMSVLIYAQDVQVIYSVPTMTSSVGRNLDANDLVFVRSTERMYRITVRQTSPTRSLQNIVTAGQATVVLDNLTAITATSYTIGTSNTLTQSNVNKVLFNNSVQATDTLWGRNLYIDGAKTTANLAEFINDDDGALGDSSCWINKYGHIYTPILDATGLYGAYLDFDDGNTGTYSYGRMIFDINDTTLKLCRSTLVAPQYVNVLVGENDSIRKSNGLYIYESKVNLNDSVLITMPTGIMGKGSIVANSGAEYMNFVFAADGTVTLLTDVSTNVDDANTANKLSVYDLGGGIGIRNNIGPSSLNIHIEYSTPWTP